MLNNDLKKVLQKSYIPIFSKKKKKLIAEDKIKKENPLPEIKDEEIPFEIPESWKWVRLGDIVSYGGVKQSLPEELNQDSWILELEDIESNTGILLRKKQI